MSLLIDGHVYLFRRQRGNSKYYYCIKKYAYNCDGFIKISDDGNRHLIRKHNNHPVVDNEDIAREFLETLKERAANELDTKLEDIYVQESENYPYVQPFCRWGTAKREMLLARRQKAQSVLLDK